MFGALLMALLLSPQTAAAGGRGGAVMAQAARPSAGQETVLEIGAHGYRADGRLLLASTESPTGADNFAGFVFGGDSFCSLGASDSEPQADPAFGWHVSGRVLQRTDDGWDVEFDWQRVWDSHRRLVDGPRGSQRVTLRSGDRLALDSVTASTTGTCGVVAVRLEASTVSRPIGRLSASPGGGGGVGGAALATDRGAMLRSAAAERLGALASGNGSASSGAGSGGSVASSGGAAAGSVAASGGSVMRIVQTVPTPVSNLPLLVFDLWLVHGLPGGTEDAQHQSITTTPMGGTFLFQPITIGTSQGEATVRLTGSVSITTDVSGDKQLRLLVLREVSFSDGSNGLGGTTKFSLMPGPADVLSFELPPLTVGRPQTLTTISSDALSLRVRITPVLPAKD